MSHLGERLTALVDEELDHDERDRALAHLAICADCRAEADLLRRLKGRLRGLDCEAPSSELVGRLFALGEQAGPVPVPMGMPAPSSVRRRPRDTRPGGRVTRSRRPRRVRYLLVGAATFAVLGVGSASFAAGGSHDRLPEVSPSLDQFAVEHALTSGDVPTGTSPLSATTPPDGTTPLSATTPPTAQPSVVPERAGAHAGAGLGASDQGKGTAKP